MHEPSVAVMQVCDVEDGKMVFWEFWFLEKA